MTVHSLPDYVRRQAEERPGAVAVVMGQESLTYGDLDRSSNRLAHLLRDAGVDPGERVAMLLPKSPSTIMAMLAVLKAGGVYVPVDLASPAARVGRILASAQPRVVLGAPPASGLLSDLTNLGPLPVDVTLGAVEATFGGDGFAMAFSRDDYERCPASPPAGATAPEDPAHLLFTSGSTGVPKGVVITHGNVIHFVEWATGYFSMGPSDRVSGHPPLHFDLSTFDIFGTFAAGAQLHLVPPSLNLLPHRLADFIEDSALTQWFSVPATLVQLDRSGALNAHAFPALRRVLWCGEVLPTPVLMSWMHQVPQASFTNLYGPTEATIASSYHTLPAPPADEHDPVPIGRACPGEELLVLDSGLCPVPPGEVGDLYIAGNGLSPGYWRDEDRTRAAFLPDPRTADQQPGCPAARIYRTGDLARVSAGGDVYFLGRSDSQIKSRGYRIELGEIEAALNAVPGLRECAVTAVASEGFESSTICCAYVAVDGEVLGERRLRAELSTLLPAYMIPARWLALEALPKNPNGKTDRPGVRALFDGAARGGGD